MRIKREIIEIDDEVIVRAVKERISGNMFYSDNGMNMIQSGNTKMLCASNLSNDIPQHEDRKELIRFDTSKYDTSKVPIMERDDEKEFNLIEKFIGKMERTSRSLINNNDVQLSLEQERGGNFGWLVCIKDGVINNPRLEVRNFGDSYEDAEGYYSKLFFKYQFEEI